MPFTWLDSALLAMVVTDDMPLAEAYEKAKVREQAAQSASARQDCIAVDIVHN